VVEVLGLTGDNLQLREHDAGRAGHYAKEGAGTSDVEYRFPFTAPGFGELEGVAHRSNFDLRQHEEHSGRQAQVLRPHAGRGRPNGQPKGEKYFPHVIEPARG
jgi:glycyl-tRNA synthetase